MDDIKVPTNAKMSRPNKIGKYEQLCWTCSNFYSCKWSTDFKPIEGWDAVQTTNRCNANTNVSYEIYDCPNYERD